MQLAKQGLVLVLLLLLSAPAVAGAGDPMAEVIRESPGGLTLKITFPEPVRSRHVLPDGSSFLEVTVPGISPGSDAPPGHPDLPQKGFPLGIPDGSTARVAGVRIGSTTTFSGLPPLPVPRRSIVPGDPFPAEQESFDIDAAAYGSRSLYPSQVVEMGPIMGWRHQRVQSVIVRPVRVSPATGTYEAVRELEIDVQFQPDGSPPGVRRVPVVHDAKGWDEIVDKALLNPSTARTFRTRSVPAHPHAVAQPGDVNIRIRLGSSGFSRIPFADLAAAGLPAGLALGDVALQEHGYEGNLSDPFLTTDLPRRMEDNNQNGIFDAGDFLVFYGFNYKDRFNPLILNARYSYFNTYWVHVSPGGGLDYPVVDGYPVGTYNVISSFPSTEFREENNVYTHNPLDSGSSIFPIYDTLYWLDMNDRDTNLRFNAPDIDPAGTFTVRARWQGNDVGAATRIHIVSLELNGQAILDQATFVDRFEFLWQSPPIASSGLLRDGSNTMTVLGRTTDPNNRFYGARFDWFEVVYDRLLHADNDQLVFNSGNATGDLEFQITGFSSPDILVLDITDPEAAVELTPVVENAGGSYTAKLRVTVGARRTFAAMAGPSVVGLAPTEHDLPPDFENQAIAPGLLRDLLVAGDGSDYILITHPEFVDAWQPLVAHRESQGHRVFLCDVFEIYDQFAGGNKTPWAIQRFLAQAFRNWDPSPSFVLLGGGANEDFRNDTPLSTPDWVPTVMHYGEVPGVAGKEMAGTDSWYVMFLRQGDPTYDVLMDMHIGRIPSGSVAETQGVVQKILDYEEMGAPIPGDDWRNRGFFLADDQYSQSLLSNGPYCWADAESSFYATTKTICDSIRVRGRLPDFECIGYFLSDRLDTVDVLNRNPGPGDCPKDNNGGFIITATRDYTRANLTPVVVDELSRGHLIFEFTGHGSKNLVAHETILQQQRPRFSLSSRDFDRIDNLGRPFIFMGYACHMAEFEGAKRADEGGSLGDHAMLLPGKGAIATVASTGFEWLHTNPVAQIRTTRPLFWDLPRDPDTGRPRRLFGEAMNRGWTQLILEYPTRPDYRGMLRTYVTLADPALRVDVNVSSFQVEVGGTPWPNGKPLVSGSFVDSVGVEAVVSDDVDVRSIRVLEAGVELPPGRVTLTPPGTGEQGAQFYQVAFQTVLRLGSYDVEILATDWLGRTSRFALPVELTTVFKKRTGERPPTLIEPGARVDPKATVVIEVDTPAPLVQGDIHLFVDGTEETVTATQVSPTHWVLEVGGDWDEREKADPIRFPPGTQATHNVEVRISNASAECVPGSCPVVRSLNFVVSRDPISVENMYFYPNPATTSGRLVYTLNRDAAEAILTIYSVSGRQVLRKELRGLDAPSADRNSILWDLRDSAGDEVANGVYLAVLSFTDTNRQTDTNRSDPELIVVAR